MALIFIPRILLQRCYYFDPAFWKFEDALVKIVVYYNRHVIKQSRDTRLLPREEKYSSVTATGLCVFPGFSSLGKFGRFLTSMV
jgi:hypothetical protein